MEISARISSYRKVKHLRRLFFQEQRHALRQSLFGQLLYGSKANGFTGVDRHLANARRELQVLLVPVWSV